MSDGAFVGLTSIQWDVSMGCDKPYWVTLCSQAYNKADYFRPYLAGPDYPVRHKYRHNPRQRVYIIDGRARYIDIGTPCRKCTVCLKNRSKLWTKRARYEIIHSQRTWFATLTINPYWRFQFSLRSGSRNFHASHREISKEITKYFKRLRKAGLKFRYLCVTEAHKDGYPHIHMLMHEGATPLRKAELQHEWQFGYSSFKLVKDPGAVGYVTKYLTKDSRTRVRASQHYGLTGPDL